MAGEWGVYVGRGAGGSSGCSLSVKSGIIQLHQEGGKRKEEENSISAISSLGLLDGGAHTRTHTRTLERPFVSREKAPPAGRTAGPHHHSANFFTSISRI